MCKNCKSIKIEIHAGHGLDYKTTKNIKKNNKYKGI